MKKTAFLLLPLLAACSQKPSEHVPKVVTIDFDNIAVIPFDGNDLTMFETVDSSLLRTIEGLEHIDGKSYVATVQKFSVFDNNGNYLYDIGRKGEGPGEFMKAQSFWTEGDTVCLFDNSLRRQLRYDKDGTFFETRPYTTEITDTIIPLPLHLYPAPDGSGYYALNCYMGGWPDVETASWLNRDMKFVNVIPGRMVGEGSYILNRARSDKASGRMLYWEAFRDTLFCITPDTIAPLYYFDFGKYSLPDDIGAMQWQSDRNTAFLDANASPMVSLLASFQSAGDVLYFSMVYNKNEETYLGAYDERTGKSRVFRLVSPEDQYRMQSYFRITGDTLAISVIDTADPEANPGLLNIPLDRLRID